MSDISPLKAAQMLPNHVLARERRSACAPGPYAQPSAPAFRCSHHPEAEQRTRRKQIQGGIGRQLPRCSEDERAERKDRSGNQTRAAAEHAESEECDEERQKRGGSSGPQT